jgi:Flp pilus assembly protein protease CpaA
VFFGTVALMFPVLALAAYFEGTTFSKVVLTTFTGVAALGCTYVVYDFTRMAVTGKF